MVLGRGAFGKVYLAELNRGGTKTLWAVKAIRKDVLIDGDSIASVKVEKDILIECDHQFLSGMDYLFMD